MLYGIIPAFYTTKNFFSLNGYENVVLEYEFLKKLLFVLMLLLISVLVISYSNLFPGYGTLTSGTLTSGTLTSGTLTSGTLTNGTLTINTYLKSIIDNPFFYFSSMLTYVTIAAALRFTTLTLRNEFRFYFAKGCSKIILGKNDEIEKMKYLFLLLTSYNKYLERIVKVEITDIKKIYSIILYMDKKERNEILQTICMAIENDKLHLAKVLSSIYKISNSEFFTKKSLFKSLKIIGSILATAIPIIISVWKILNEL